MKSIDINRAGKQISIYGSKAMIEKAQRYIESLELSGIENKDRLIIQQCIDDNKLGAKIIYDGNTVYPFEKIVKMYRKLQKEETLTNLNHEMYYFFMNACGDIAHYDLSGYRIYYDDSFRKLENKFLQNCRTTSRFTDILKIFKELKIGEYFRDRENISLDNISLLKLKSIIEECGWNVISNGEEWQLQFDLDDSSKFSFDVDISKDKISNIIYRLCKYGKEFNADEYIEAIVKSRGESLIPSVRLITKNADHIAYKLSKLSSDLIYKCRIEAENTKNCSNLELELER